MNLIKIENVLIALALIFYLFIHITAISHIHNHRETLWEPDDSYHFLLKATNIENCLFYSCKGLEAVNEQSRPPSSNPSIEHIEEAHRHRMLLSYHPLLSFFSLTLKNVGLNYEQVFFCMEIILIFLLAFAILFFNISIFGKIPAAISLIFLSSFLFSSSATFYMKPYMYSSAFSLLTFTALVNNGRQKYKLAFLLSIFSILSHTIGIILTALSCLLALFIYVKKERVSISYKQNKDIINFLILSSVSLLLLYKFNLPFIEEKIKVSSVFFKSNIWEIIQGNAAHLNKIWGEFNKYVNNWVLLFIVTIGLHNLNKEARDKALIVFFIILTAIIISFFCPAIHTSFIKRIWILPMTFIAGIVGSFSFYFFSLIDNKIFKSANKIIIFLVLSTLTVVMFNHVNLGIKNLKKSTKFKIENLNLSLAKSQINKLKSVVKPKDSLVFNIDFKQRNNQYEAFEALVYFYTTYGFQKYNLILTSLISGNKEREIKWINNLNSGYFISLNPISTIIKGDFIFNKELALKINFTNKTNELWINLNNNFNESKDLFILSGEKLNRLALKPFFNGWRKIKVNNNSKLILYTNTNGIRLQGIRALNRNKFWPWDQGISIDILNKQKFNEYTTKVSGIQFSTSNYIKPLKKILDDKGSSFLARF